jgi:hypothetical protein
MKDTNEEYWEIVKGVVGGMILIIIFLLFFLSSCKTISHLKKSTNDSVSVVKTNEGSSKVDSSGSKSDKTNTKETVYYPQPIIIKGDDGKPYPVFVPQSVKETGTEKTEQVQLVKDDSWRQSFDSLKVAILSLAQDKKTTVGPSLIEWILICAVGLMFIKSFAPSIIKLIKI